MKEGEAMNGKYVVMKNGTHGNDYAVVFCNIESHLRMAEALGGVQFVLGAGEVSVGTVGGIETVSCFGESTTLGVKSRGKLDAKEVAYAIYGTISGINLD